MKIYKSVTAKSKGIQLNFVLINTIKPDNEGVAFTSVSNLDQLLGLCVCTLPGTCCVIVAFASTLAGDFRQGALSRKKPARIAELGQKWL